MKILPLIETMLLPSSEIFLKLINRHPLQGKGGGELYNLFPNRFHFTMYVCEGD